tara:strand:+ start:3605 stop:4546 length:942 start_codon:yes stop_codon:yes gene_type:complete
MSILADRQYTLEHFKNREKMSNITELNQEIIQKINSLAKRVGAPSYQKTPVFKRNNYIKKDKNISSDDWNAIRNFKNTVLTKNKNGLEAKKDKIRSYLNKLTDSNYDEIYECIIIIIKDILKEDAAALENIGESIFEIGSLNKFWSSLYARLYKDLITNYPIMQEICIRNFNSFESLFNNINTIDSNENYNLFCEYNKENEKRRALSNFFIYCTHYEIIDKKNMENIILNFINKIKKLIKIENENKIVDEIVQNLCIMLISGKQFIKTLDSYIYIKKFIKEFSEIHYKKYPSISQKIIFKFMDLNDELDDDSD